jgi:hypothetical protein
MIDCGTGVYRDDMIDSMMRTLTFFVVIKSIGGSVRGGQINGYYVL